MVYNINPNFAKYMNDDKNKNKFIVKTETSNAQPDEVHRINTKLINFLNKDNFEEENEIYKLEDLDHPNGWLFKELDMLGEMGFKFSDEYKMVTELDVPTLKMECDKMDAYVYKTEEGYVLETNRKYVFESFNKMLEFIDSIPIKQY